MIQRIQSIFLLLSGLSFLGLFAVPFATSSTAIPQIFNDLVYNIQDHVILLVLCISGMVLSLSNIFLFNNRPVQLRISYLIAVVSILLPLVAVLLVYNEGTVTTQADKISDNAGIYLPILSLIFSMLAARYINRDENTVKSMDRLR